MNPAINVAEPAMSTTYTRLISLLDSAGARYRLIDHAPEGRTLEASVLRGHPAPQAAKCMVARIKIAKGTARHALAVIPGDRRTDLGRLTEVLGGRSAVLAARDTAEALTGCVSGSIVPFSFHPDLQLITDPDLLVRARPSAGPRRHRPPRVPRPRPMAGRRRAPGPSPRHRARGPAPRPRPACRSASRRSTGG